MVLASHVLSVPSVCGKTLDKEYEKWIQSEKWKHAETKENSQRRPNNHSLAIKHGQGP